VKNRLLKGLALAATLSFAAGVTIVPAQAASEILIWADETRGPNLTKVFAKKSDWVPGSTIKVVSFSSYDALKDALDQAQQVQIFSLQVTTGFQHLLRAESLLL
jgi:ABC-type metal ion transport system substrate-binding protein